MNEFTGFALVIISAGILGALFTKIKQPAILGYIVCGLLIGLLFPNLRHEFSNLELLGKVGVAFLLFILGLNLNTDELKRLGKVAVITGLGQIFFTFIIGIFLSLAIGFSFVASLYISIGLTLSSTIIIVKLLTQKNQLDSLHGRISIGFLLVQDFIAIFILVLLSTLGNVPTGDTTTLFIVLFSTIAKGSLLLIGVYLFAQKFFYKFLNSIKHEPEVLFITVICWALALAVIMGSPIIGLTAEIGALVAGITLSNRIEILQIESWARPLRDFFIIIFFVVIGLQVSFDSIEQVIIPAIIFSLFVLIGNPIIVLLIMGALKYSSKVGFFVSLAVAQISEFSLIVTKFGYDLGHIDSKVLTLMTLVGGITMIISSYMILFNDKLYEFLKPVLKIFEFYDDLISEKNNTRKKAKYEIVLLGCHRMGEKIIKDIEDKKKLLIVDYDSKKIKELKKEKYNVLYGDLSDTKLYKHFFPDTIKIMLSTIPNLTENLKILEYIKENQLDILTVVTASDDHQATELYRHHADVVIYPHLLGSNMIKSIVKNKGLSPRNSKIISNQIKSLIIE